MNNITKVQNLQRCESLQKLDLTVNFVDKAGLLSLASLRANPHLRELYLLGNPCADWPGYRQLVAAMLPQLRKLVGGRAAAATAAARSGPAACLPAQRRVQARPPPALKRGRTRAAGRAGPPGELRALSGAAAPLDRPSQDGQDVKRSERIAALQVAEELEQQLRAELLAEGARRATPGQRPSCSCRRTGRCPPAEPARRARAAWPLPQASTRTPRLPPRTTACCWTRAARWQRPGTWTRRASCGGPGARPPASWSTGRWWARGLAAGLPGRLWALAQVCCRALPQRGCTSTSNPRARSPGSAPEPPPAPRPRHRHHLQERANAEAEAKKRSGQADPFREAPKPLLERLPPVEEGAPFYQKNEGQWEFVLQVGGGS